MAISTSKSDTKSTIEGDPGGITRGAQITVAIHSRSIVTWLDCILPNSVNSYTLSHPLAPFCNVHALTSTPIIIPMVALSPQVLIASFPLLF